MASNREAYFKALSFNIPKEIINFALEEINGFDHLELTSHFDDEIKDYDLFLKVIERYQSGEMIEYIFNKSYFCGYPLYVDKNVLIPRQETEDLVLRTIRYIESLFPNKSITIADVCTGSGAIGIALAKKLPNNHYFLSDISKEAVRVANKNIETLCKDIDIKVLEGDLLEPLKGYKFDVIICNPPYISDISTIDKKTWNEEPHLALIADPNTKYYEQILKQYKKITNKECLLAFEIGEDMEKPLTKIVEKYCKKCSYIFKKDIYGKSRFLFIKQ